MANLAYRRDVVFRGLGSYVAPYGSVSVMALPAGAQVTSNSSSTTATVRAGHGFRANDKFIIWRNGAQVASSFNTVTAVGATTLTITAMTLTAGDTLVNLGADTGISSPNWDGATLRSVNPVNTYSDMAGGSANTNATVTTNATGEFEYWHAFHTIWELARASVNGVMTVLDVDIRPQGGMLTAGSENFRLYLADTIPFGFSGASSAGLIMDKLSTYSGAPAIAWSRNGSVVWQMGEDYATGDRSYFALWSDKGNTGSVSADILAIMPYGLAPNFPTEGPKWRFNSSYDSTSPTTYDETWTFNFYGKSRTTALFQSMDSTSSGGIHVYVAGGNNALELRQQDGSTYRSSIRFCRTTTAGGGTINADWLVGMGIVTGADTWSIFDQTASATRYLVNSTGSHILSNVAGTTTPTFIFDLYAQTANTNVATSPFAIRLKSTGTAAANLASYAQFRMTDANGTEYRSGSVGTIMTDATAGAPKGSLELWSSYNTAAIVTCTQNRTVGINQNTAGANTALWINVSGNGEAAISLAPSTTRPGDPASSAEGRIYMKGGVFVIQYNDAGTVRYLSIPMTGTGTTWTHDTTPI